MTLGTYMGQPVQDNGKAQEAWKALLGETQSRAVWVGDDLEFALCGVEAGQARLNTYAWCGLGVWGLAVLAYHFGPELPKLPVSLNTVLMAGSVGFGVANLWLSLTYRQRKGEAEERIGEHREFLVNLAKGDLQDQLIRFLQEADLVGNDLLAYGGGKMETKRSFQPSTAWSVWLEPVGFSALVAEIVAAKLH